MNDSEPVKHARAAAQRLLAYRPRSEAEVRTRLSRRFPPCAVDGALDSLKRAGLVDDDAFARLWTDSRVSHRPRSAALIRRELLEKGVSRETAEAATEGVDDAENAYRAGLRWLPSLAAADYDTFRRRLWGRLERRGFPQSLIRETVARLWEERGGEGEAQR